MAGLVRDRRFETTFIVAPVGGGWLCEYITASPGKIASGGIFLSSSLSLSSTPSFFILAASILFCHPLYAAAHLRSLLSVFQIIVEFHQPINVAHPREEACARMHHRSWKSRDLFFPFPPFQPAAILGAERTYSLHSSLFSFFPFL